MFHILQRSRTSWLARNLSGTKNHNSLSLEGLKTQPEGTEVLKLRANRLTTNSCCHGCGTSLVYLTVCACEEREGGCGCLCLGLSFLFAFIHSHLLFFMVSKYLCSISPALKTARTDVCTVHSDMAAVTIKYGNASVPDDK